MSKKNTIRRRRLFQAALVLTCVALSPSRASETIRCDGKLIQVGQARIEVLKYCGEPQDSTSFLDERTTHTRLAVMQQGMTRFTRSTGSYVETSRETVTPPNTNGRDTNGKNSGVTTLPQTHTHDETRIAQNQTETIAGSYLTLSTFWECKKVSIFVDEIVYNFGPGRFLTYIRLENGRVKDITQSDYGF